MSITSRCPIRSGRAGGLTRRLSRRWRTNLCRRPVSSCYSIPGSGLLKGTKSSGLRLIINRKTGDYAGVVIDATGDADVAALAD